MDYQDLADLINLERIETVEEADRYIKVMHNGRDYTFSKCDLTGFYMGDEIPSVSGSMVMRLEQEMQLLLPNGLFQDEEAPQEFKEVMMFHEIREMQYKEAGFDDAHQRAVHDEVLYVFKFLDREMADGYFAFAKKYRIEQTLKEIIERVGTSGGGTREERSARSEKLKAEDLAFLDKLVRTESTEKLSSIKGLLSSVISTHWVCDFSKIMDYVKSWSTTSNAPLIAEVLMPELVEAHNGRFDWSYECIDDVLKNCPAYHDYVQPLVRMMQSSEWYAAHAGSAWPDNLFNQYSRQIVESVLKDPESAGQALKYWPAERSEKYKDLLLAAIKVRKE